MMASELIEDLQALMAEHGDCAIVDADSCLVIDHVSWEVHPNTLEPVFELWIDNTLK